MDVVSEWAWVVWIALVLVFAVVEMLSLDLTFFMFALGSVGGLVSGLLGAPWWLQVPIAAVLALVLLFFVRPALHRRLRRGADPAKTNVEALIGIRGIALAPVDGGRGQVKLGNGETWTARTRAGSAVGEGVRVVVTGIEGATAVVEPAESPRTEDRERIVP